MNILKRLLRKSVIIPMTTIATMFLFTQPVYAQGLVELLLMRISAINYSILSNINNLPTYITDITQMAQNLNNTNDQTNIMANYQYAFANLQQINATSLTTQMTNSQNATSQFLLAGSFDQNNPILPQNANDLNYSILFNQPLPNTQAPQNIQTSQQNFINNLAGMGTILKQPSPAWKKSAAATNYTGFYNSIAAINSYNAYTLNGMLAQPSSNNLNNYLIGVSSSSDWFKNVAAEPLGVVARQILMFTSQIYVLLNQLITLQQNMLGEMATLNTLISLEAQQLTGSQLYQSAQSTQ